MKRLSVVALALAAGSLAFAAAKPAGPSTPLRVTPTPLRAGSLDALLFAAMSAPASVSYTGIVQIVQIGRSAAEASVCRVEHRAPDLTRRTYTTPASLSGDSVVSEGELTFSIDARRRQIVESRSGPFDDSLGLRADYSLLHENYRVVRKGDETFDGRQTIDLALVNKYDDRSTMLVRIDEASKIVLDKQEFAPDGALVSEMRFEEIRYTRSIPDADFALPKQYALVEGPALGSRSEKPDRVVRSAGFAAREPRSLPDGFSPVEGNVVELRGVRTVHLLYSDGVRTVSLFENAKASTVDMRRLQPRPLRVGGHSAEYAEDGATALLGWSDGSLYYTLVGEFGLVDLPRIAASITP
jgi:negative regulator of sigma E activity